MMRSINSSNMGTVKAVSPWLGLQIVPLLINWLRVGARELTERFNSPAIIAGTVRAGAELCHGPHVLFLRGCEPIKPDQKETLVKSGSRQLRRYGNIGSRDWRTFGDIPSVLAPFLQEVRIAARLVNDGVKGVVIYYGLLRLGRVWQSHAERLSGTTPRSRETQKAAQRRISLCPCCPASGKAGGQA